MARCWLWLGFVALLTHLSPVLAGVEWTFTTPGDTGGWQPLHGIHCMEVREGALQLVMDPADPYFYSGEQPLELPAAEFAWLEVRMKIDRGGVMQFYWVTAESPEWYGPDRKRLTCRVLGDGAWRTYRIRLDRHPGWKGRITHLRLDPIEGYGLEGGEVHAALQFIRLRAAVPEEDVIAHLSRPLPERGRPFRLFCRVHNGASTPLTGVTAELALPEGISWADGGGRREFPPLPPGRGALVAWRLRAEQVGPFEVAAEVRLGSGPTLRITRRFLVSEPFPEGPPDRPAGAVIRVTPQAVTLANRQVRLAFPCNRFGYGRGELSRYDPHRKRWLPLARMRSLSRLVAGGPGCDQDLYALQFQILSAGPKSAELAFHTSAVDGSGARWSAEFRFALAADSDTLRARYRAVPDRTTDLYRLDGPTLYVGEGTFGARKDAAVFPGLEYLQGDQDSSSLRDFTNDWRFRMAPHPYRVTLPAPSVTYRGSVVGLLWDALYRWAGTEAGMTGTFASPNTVADFAAWDEAGDHHLIGLFVPSVPRYVPENHTVAAEPYPARAGQPIRLEAHLLASAAEDPTAAVRRWIALYGLPEPARPPRDLQAARELCLAAYLETLWSPEQRGWKPYGEFQEYRPNAWIEMLLRWEALAAVNPSMRRKLRERVAAVADRRVEGPVGCDPTWTKVPYFLGAFNTRTLSWLEGEVREALRTQGEDGSWRYVVQPLPKGFEHCPPLGDPALKSIYQTAAQAGKLLRWAHITGDPTALAAGLKALRWLASGEVLVPQGAPFEDPAASPYLLSSALAAEAFVLGYRATGDPDCLKGARYWARSGLPFLYLWNLPGVPLQRYATIGVFGSSYYEHASWLGRPVQWIGLEYAYALRHLAPYDRSLPWQKIAQGITISALYQQASEGPYRGLYPDSVEGAGDFAEAGFRARYGLWIQPDLILINLMAEERRDPEIQFFRQPLGGRLVWVTSAARIDSLRASPDGSTLDLRLRYFPGEAPATVIAGWGRPVRVECEGQALPAVPESLSGVPAGWIYDEARGLIYLKIPFRRPKVAVRLIGRTPAS